MYTIKHLSRFIATGRENGRLNMGRYKTIEAARSALASKQRTFKMSYKRSRLVKISDIENDMFVIDEYKTIKKRDGLETMVFISKLEDYKQAI